MDCPLCFEPTTEKSVRRNGFLYIRERVCNSCGYKFCTKEDTTPFALRKKAFYKIPLDEISFDEIPLSLSRDLEVYALYKQEGTLRKAAEKLGISFQRVHQIVKKVENKNV